MLEAERRLAYISDTAIAAQGDSKTIKEAIDSLQKVIDRRG